MREWSAAQVRDSLDSRILGGQDIAQDGIAYPGGHIVRRNGRDEALSQRGIRDAAERAQSQPRRNRDSVILGDAAAARHVNSGRECELGETDDMMGRHPKHIPPARTAITGII